MTLRRHLSERHDARERVIEARRRSRVCMAPVRRHFGTQPLTWVAAAAGGGAVAGYATGRNRKGRLGFWYSPTWRLLLRLFLSAMA